MALSEEQLARLTPDELLDCIIEEAAEVIQAAQKVRRFGPTQSHASYHDGAPNHMIVHIEGKQIEMALRHYASRYGERSADMVHHLRFMDEHLFAKLYRPLKEQSDEDPKDG